MNKKDRRKIRAVTGLLVLALIVVGSFVSANAASPKLSKKKATVTVGKTVKLKVKNTGSKVRWTSSNKKVATVKKSGKYGAVVTGKKAGKTTITAKVGGKKLKCKITVKKKTSGSTSNEGIALERTFVGISKGKSVTVKVTGTMKSITSVSSSKTSVATVKKTGARSIKITGKKDGKSTIRVKIAGKTLKCTANVSSSIPYTELEAKNKKVAQNISVSIQTSLTHKDVEQECRNNTNVPADLKMFDTVTISITNHHSKSVEITEAGLEEYAILGKRFKHGKTSYGFSVRGESEDWVPYYFYAPIMRSDWMKTITVNPGETKSITYCMHIDMSEYSQDYINYVDGKYGDGYLENEYNFSGIKDKTEISLVVTEYPFEYSTRNKKTPGNVTYYYYPASNRLIADWYE